MIKQLSRQRVSFSELSKRLLSLKSNFPAQAVAQVGGPEEGASGASELVEDDGNQVCLHF